MMRANGSFAVDLTFVLSKGGGDLSRMPHVHACYVREMIQKASQ